MKIKGDYLLDTIGGEYDVKEEKATADVKKFLEKLRTKGLLEE